jgi:hypothetical protein
MSKQLKIKMGNVTLREREINWVPNMYGKKNVDSHMVLTFDVESPCGSLVQGAVIVHEPESTNPGLNIINQSATIGVACIQRVLMLLEEWRKQKGLPMSKAAEAVLVENNPLRRD